MDENTNTEPTLESVTAELETWKGHARDWETKAKANLTDLDTVKTELDALKAEQADISALTTDLETVRTELTTAQTDKTRLGIALEFGLSLEDANLLHGDEPTQRALAERLKKPAGMSPDPHQGRNDTNKKLTGAEAFASIFEG